MKMKTIQITMLILTFALMLSGALSSSFAQNPPYIDILENSSRTIRIDGLVNNPINITIQELIQMPAIKVPAALFCYNTLVGAGVWEGPQLSLLLEMAELNNNTASLKFFADDGYTTRLTIEKAMEEDVIIAYAIDDQPLPELRLVVPGENGAVWITLINHIQATSYVLVTVPTTEMNPAPTLAPSPSPSPMPELSPSPSPSPAPSPSPSPMPEPSPSNPVELSDTDSFPLVWIVAAVGAATIVSAILIVYKKKGEK
ncbi:hypothetical protein AC478_00055 [miscellaneous Crenarchaeota group-1 archaeon SG8-32-3]|uniref:Oxidoreductase molybdopterin-binding domain-containing protein n=1 Tax=miscellaneous Crenarchaeota group-1 archaeon SG8-32-3 TaxID=1685125 RepID=A0A0M0BV32_9ARCH|nr:MAG: hypothetical protein AC478_00055 [miscellaneous Crenarchaeota group-1 archaeon SG8-32-3]